MPFEYLFKEFGPDAEPDAIREWLAKHGNDGWEAVGLAPMLHLSGGDVIAGVKIPMTPRFGYTFLMKRVKA